MNNKEMKILAKANKTNEQTVINIYIKSTGNKEDTMKVMEISYPTPLSTLSDIENDNIDVSIKLEDGTNITVVVSTPQNLIQQMNNENVNFISASQPDIIVRSLTYENIQQAIEDYANGDAFWLKLLYVASIEKKVVDMSRINLFLEEMNRLNNELLE
ncbi:hypothetical protein GCM10010912_69580 [Paenibacillus albidus]|uniref:Uncharacterized protein n=1 Tax=Paenibacillus albidus TaxID=2041023 RepID=A0A917FZH5_9BACL|nr:hypothetical protein [Paenibacillus albidus]GGG15239.1 hypothetical protein GCM10010912_69580 [Paenibacillus albidus]